MNNDKNKPQDNLQGFSDESIKEFITNNVDNGKRNIIIVSGENNSGKTSFIEKLKDNLGDEFMVYTVDAVREASQNLKFSFYKDPFFSYQNKNLNFCWIKIKRKLSFLKLKPFAKINKYLIPKYKRKQVSNLDGINFVKDFSGLKTFLRNFSVIFSEVIHGDNELKIERIRFNPDRENLMKYIFRSFESFSFLLGAIGILIFFMYWTPFGHYFENINPFVKPLNLFFILLIIYILNLYVREPSRIFFLRNHYYTLTFDSIQKKMHKSEGTFQLIPNICLIYILIYHKTRRHKKTFFSISEPESHLHPAAQARLAKEYYAAIKKNKGKNVTLVFETHSEEMIKSFAQCFIEKDQEINFFWLNLKKNNFDLKSRQREFYDEKKKFNYPEGEDFSSESTIREQYELEIKAQREIISYITHTIGNILNIVPARVKTTMELMDTFSNEEKANPAFYMAMSEIVSLNSTFAFLDNMVKTFKVFIRNKDALLSDILKEDKKEVDAGYILSVALQNILNKLLFETEYYKYKSDIIGRDNSQIDKAFINEIMIQQSDSIYDSQKIITWMKKHFPFWEIDLNFGLYRFSTSGIKTNLIISILLELIDNAIKHSIEGGKIVIKWLETDMGIDFICTNFYDIKNTSEGKGGLLFLSKIEAILEKNIEIQNKKEQGINTVRMHINTKILSRQL